jgi:hypothetical protein
MTKRVVLIAMMVAVAGSGFAQDDPCPCVPIAKIWVARECDTWNCAVAELIKAEGDPMVFTLPTSSSQYKWVVIRRVPSGSSISLTPAAFVVESFDNSTSAAVQHAIMDPAKLPMLVTTVDGKSLLVALKEPDPARRRAVRR